MFIELGLAGVGCYAYSWLNDSWKRTIKREFNKVMEGIGIYNKQEQTFSILNVFKTSYGLKCIVGIPKGLSLEHLLSKQNIIEDNFGCIIEISKGKFSSSAAMYIIWEDVASYKYSPIECKPWQLWLGKDIKGEDYFLDLNKDPHLLIGGTTGTGKSFELACILTNLIYHNSENVEIYLSQLVKGEIGAFANCEGVNMTAYTHLDILSCLEHVCKVLDNRSSLFTSCGIKNITQWNKHYPNRYMKRIIFVIEELSFFIDTDLWDYILRIVKAGRSVGIHLVGLLQRSTATNLNTDVKSQMTRLTFKQKSSIDSTNIIGIPDATQLEDRECILDSNNGIVRLKTAWIDEDFYLLHKYLPSIAIPHKPNRVNREIKNILNNSKKEVKKEKKEEAKQHLLLTAPVKKVPAKRKRRGVINLEEIK